MLCTTHLLFSVLRELPKLPHNADWDQVGPVARAADLGGGGRAGRQFNSIFGPKNGPNIGLKTAPR